MALSPKGTVPFFFSFPFLSMSDHVCFITTCSRLKKEGGKSIGEFRSDLHNNGLLRARKSVLQAIRKERARGRIPNEGPDFGGTHDGVYLRAVDLYGPGSFVGAMDRAFNQDETMWNLWFEMNQLYFISGLYGLVRYDEPIQAYDVDLGDTRDIWLPKRTMITDSLAKNLILSDIKIVFDCCALMDYSELIDWRALSEKGFTVRHAYSAEFEDDQIRAAAGYFAAEIDSKIRQREILDGRNLSTIDAEIRFISTDEIEQNKQKSVLESHLERIGLIAWEDSDRQKFEERFRGLSGRYIKIELIGHDEGKKGLERLKELGCKQCITRKPPVSHADTQKRFGAENISKAISKYSMRPIVVNSYTELTIEFGNRLS